MFTAMPGCLSPPVVEGMDKWIDGHMVGWMDGWIDR